MYVVKQQAADRYETIDVLADGATGRVQLARDRLLDRLVAIKTLKLHGVKDQAERERLREAILREAGTVQLLSHPNIVVVYDVLDNDPSEAPALVMEYVQGTTLAALLKGGTPLPLDFALSTATQLAQALDHAHSMGIVHGDIKPQNILITDNNERAKLVDFGIARLLGAGSGNHDNLMGSPRYVAPELLLGQATDHRADIFSFGVVLYEMLSGRSPFAGKTVAEVTQSILKGGIDLSAERLPEVPDFLRRLLLRALQKDPSARFRTAVELLKALKGDATARTDDETVATQDLSELVVPEVPEVDGTQESTAEVASEEATPTTTSRPAGSYSSTTREPLPVQRLALFAGATLAAMVVLGLLVVWLVAPSGPPDGTFPRDHKTRLEVVPLLKEGHRLLRAGEPEIAARIFRRAEAMAPRMLGISRLRQAAEQEARDLRQYQQAEDEVGKLLATSRTALDRGSRQAALRLATQALSIEPENPEARALAESATLGRARPAQPTASTPQRQQAPPSAQQVQQQVARPVVAPRPVASQEATPPPPPPVREPVVRPTTAELRIDVFSYLPKGVLTVYANREQVLLQPFRFVEKSGLLRRKGSAGRLETALRLKAGEVEFRIYVSADGQETQTVNLTATLTGGETHVLRIIIAENGSASAQLN